MTLTSSLLATGASAYICARIFGSEGESDTAYSIRDGYFFSNSFAVEGFYSQFYDEFVEIDDGTGPVTVSGKLSGNGLGSVGKTHFDNDQTGFNFTGRVGVMRGEIEVSASGIGSESETSYKPYYGVGRLHAGPRPGNDRGDGGGPAR